MPVNDTEEVPFSSSIKYAMVFAWVFILFIFSWISVAVVGRAIDNICFTSLGLSDKSTLHTCVIAFVIVLIELLTLYYFNTLGMELYNIMPDLDATSSKSNPKSKKSVSDPYHQNDINFFDEMSGVTILAQIEGIAIV